MVPVKNLVPVLCGGVIAIGVPGYEKSFVVEEGKKLSGNEPFYDFVFEELHFDADEKMWFLKIAMQPVRQEAN